MADFLPLIQMLCHLVRGRILSASTSICAASSCTSISILVYHFEVYTIIGLNSLSIFEIPL
jgi:hypothetical protein